jgi:zinc protease
MIDSKTCPDCGTMLPPDAPMGVCPKCLLKVGIDHSDKNTANEWTLLTGSQPQADSPTIPPTKHNSGVRASAPEIGTQVRYFGDYELLSEIARGGMGVVYKARQVRLNRVVALKMILAGQLAGAAEVQRFHTEAESAAQLDHPGIVPIFEVGEYDGHHFFSMGFVDGDSLAKRIADAPLAPREAAGLVQKVSDAIQFAHDHGVIHRDLKPANVLLDKDGQPRVTDFGVAKKVKGDSNLTGAGQVLGTPSYMPPEQAAGRVSELRETADVYSLGAILYELLTGRPPFRAETPLDTLMQVLEMEPVHPRLLNPRVPRDIETICLKCLEKDPRRRYDSAQKLSDELQRFLRGEPIHARRITPVGRGWRWCLRNPGVASLTAGLVCTLIGGVIGIVFQRSLREVEAEQHRRLKQVVEISAEDQTFHYQLENGLTVLMRPIEGAKTISLIVLYSLGGDQDPKGQSGLAHLSEHIYVTAAAGDTPARTVYEFVQRYPNSWNAQTGDGYTVIATEFPAEKLADELADAAARMSDLRVTAADIQREMPRLRDEVRNMYAAIPMLASRNMCREMVRPTPAGGQRGGMPEQAERITAKQVQERWKRFYKPRNAIVALAGKIDVTAAREAIATRFAALPPGEPLPAARAADPPQLGKIQRKAVKPIQPGARSEVCFGYAAPEPTDPLFPAFLILVARLQNNAMMFQPGNPFAGDFPVTFAPLDDPGILYVRAVVKEGETPDDTIARLEQTVSKLIAPELQRHDAKGTNQTFSFVLGTANLPDAMLLQNTYGAAFRIGRRAQLGINASKLSKAIEAVGESELRRAARDYFAPDVRATAVVTVE